jgi:hypothetical protein
VERVVLTTVGIEGDFQPWNISGQAVTRQELNSTNATESRFPDGTIRAACWLRISGSLYCTRRWLSRDTNP